MGKQMPDVLCHNCNRMLGLFSTVVGSIKCHRCKSVNRLYIISQRDSFVVDIQPRSIYNKIVKIIK